MGMVNHCGLLVVHPQWFTIFFADGKIFPGSDCVCSDDAADSLCQGEMAEKHLLFLRRVNPCSRKGDSNHKGTLNERNK